MTDNTKPANPAPAANPKGRKKGLTIVGAQARTEGHELLTLFGRRRAEAARRGSARTCLWGRACGWRSRRSCGRSTTATAKATTTAAAATACTFSRSADATIG